MKKNISPVASKVGKPGFFARNHMPLLNIYIKYYWTYKFSNIKSIFQNRMPYPDKMNTLRNHNLIVF